MFLGRYIKLQTFLNAPSRVWEKNLPLFKAEVLCIMGNFYSCFTKLSVSSHWQKLTNPFAPLATTVNITSYGVSWIEQAENRKPKDRNHQQPESCGANCVKIECALRGVSTNCQLSYMETAVQMTDMSILVSKCLYCGVCDSGGQRAAVVSQNVCYFLVYINKLTKYGHHAWHLCSKQ